jgi:hypothetical protein
MRRSDRLTIRIRQNGKRSCASADHHRTCGIAHRAPRHGHGLGRDDKQKCDHKGVYRASD